MVNTRSKTKARANRGLVGRAVNAASCAAGYVFNSVKGLCTRRAAKRSGAKRSGASNKTHEATERREYYTNHNGQETYRVVGAPPPRSWHNVYDEAGEGGPWIGGKRSRKTRGRKH